MKLETMHLPMRLQFFADQANETPADDSKPTDTADEEPKGGKEQKPVDNSDDEQPVATFTKEDVDKAVSEALAKFEQKKNQAKAYEQMSKEEKLEYDRQEAQKQADEAKSTLARYEMRDQVRSEASKDGLVLDNTDLDRIVTGKADETKANYAWFKNLRDRIKDDVLEDLKKGQPLPGNNGRLPKGSKGEQLAGSNSTPKLNPYFKKGK